MSRSTKLVLPFVLLSCAVAFGQQSLWTYTPGDTCRVTVCPSGKLLVTHEFTREEGRGYICNRAVWDLATGKRLGEWTDQHYSVLSADPSYVAISYDEKNLISLGDSRATGRNLLGEIYIWSLPSGKLRSKFEFGTRANKGSVSLLPTGNHVFVTHTNEGMFGVTLSTGEIKRVSEDAWSDRALYSNADGRIVASSSGMPIYRSLKSFFSVEEPVGNLEPEREADGTGFLPEDEVISADGKWIATEHHPRRNDDFEVHLRVYDLGTRKRVAEAILDVHDISNLALSPDGKLAFATAFNKLAETRVMIYDIAKKETRFIKESYGFAGVTPGGAIIVSKYEHPFEPVDPASGEKLATPLDPKWLRPIVTIPGPAAP